MSLDLTDMQRGLALAMDRARSSSDETSGIVREEGRRLIFLLNGLVRMAGLHDASNDAFGKPSQDLEELVQALLKRLGAIHAVFVESQVYVSDIRLRMNEQEQQAVTALTADLQRHDIGGISIHKPVSAESFKRLAFAIEGDAAPKAPRASIMKGIPNTPGLQLLGSYHFRVSGEEEIDENKDVQEAISRGSDALHGAVDGLSQGRFPNPLPLRRAVIDLVDGMKQEPDVALAGSFTASRTDVGEGHLMRVTNLALALGAWIGIPEGELSNLGVAAMLHDVGYTYREGKVAHGAAGLRVLARQRGFHESKVRRLLAVYQHHQAYESAVKPSLYARILHIVDDYDVSTARRPGQPHPASPAKVLESMWSERGREYDPNLLAYFIQMMGKFPPGTLLELDDGTWALSVSGGRDRDRFEWPVVRIVRGPGGTPFPGNVSIDLFNRRFDMGAPWVLDPRESKEAGDEALERVADAQSTERSQRRRQREKAKGKANGVS